MPTTGTKRPVGAGTLIPQKEIDEAAGQLERAFALAGLVGANGLICPSCGTTKKKKVVLKPKYWKCHRCGAYGGAIKLVQDQLGVGFREAVELLLGRRPADEQLAARERQITEIAVAGGFVATEDWDVYGALLESDHVSVEAAQRYYGRWHIDPNVTAEAGARYVIDVAALRAELVETFGADRIVNAGLAMRRDGSDDIWLLCGTKYPQLEPAIDAVGRVRNLQFRPSVAQKRKVDAHKAGNGKYVPPFLSIRGAGPRHLIGIGLERLGKIEPSVVYIVEGFKDVLAARTLGFEAYGLPGVGVYPPPKVVEWLAGLGHRLVVTLDGDEAGRAAQPLVVEWFTSKGFPTERISTKTMPEGMDVTDRLVDRHARAGCTCPTCRAWRTNHR